MHSVPTPTIAADELDDDGAALRGRLPAMLAVVLTLVVVGGSIDLVLDRPSDWLSAHVLFELGMVALSLGFAVVLWRGWWRAERSLADARRSLAATRRDLAERQAERDAWRRSAEGALAGVRQAIDRQLDAWELTGAEREVARLLLKGHGHKQVAALTGRSERTVRQHAVSVYRKAGISGRAELAAFFFDGLLGADAADATSEPAASRHAP